MTDEIHLALYPGHCGVKNDGSISTVHACACRAPSLASSHHFQTLSVIYPTQSYLTFLKSIHGSTCNIHNTAWHVITVTVLAFLTQENKASKTRSTINQLKHRKGRAVRNNGTRGVVSIDHTPRTIIACTALPSVL